MNNRANSRAIGIIAIIVMATSIASIASVSDGEINPESSGIYGEQREFWELLGAKKVNFKKAKKTIYPTRKYGRMDMLQLRSVRNKTQIHFVKVYFTDGTKQEVQIPVENRGDAKQTIYFIGGSRLVRKVTFWVIKKEEAIGNGSVSLWGTPTASRGDQYDNNRGYID